MIATSVDTKDFRRVTTDPTFRVESPHLNPLIAGAPLEVTQSTSGLSVKVAAEAAVYESPSVEAVLEEVLKSSERDVELHPNSSRAYTNLAIAFLKRENYEEAIKHLERALALDSTNYVALNTLALVRVNQGDLDRAAELYHGIREMYPANPTALISLAHIQLRRGNFVQAADLLSDVVRLDEKSVTARYQLAMVSLTLGKAHQSIQLLRQATRLDSRSHDLYQALAVAYLAAGDFRHAERAFKSALALNPQMSSAINGLAVLKSQQKRFDEVIALLLDHLSQFPDDTAAREILANAYTSVHQFQRARVQLMQLVSSINMEAPADRSEAARISNNIGYCFAQEGLHTDAEYWLKRSLEYAPGASAAPYNNLARAYLAQERPNLALQILDPERQHFPRDAQSYLLREAAFLRLGRSEDAIEELQQLLNTAAPPAAAYFELGWLLSDWRDDQDGALAVLRKGAALYPSDPFLVNNLAYVYLMKGEPEYARAVLDPFPESKDHIHLTATRGLLRLWEGNFEDANRLYKKAEQAASHLGQSDLARLVRQKKHLEFARAYLRNGNRELAIQHVQAGLRVPTSTAPYKYRQDIERLRTKLLGAAE